MRILLIIFLHLCFCIKAQKQGINWFFGNYAGITFTNGGPVANFNGLLGISPGETHNEGTSVISDSTGAVLFYTNGQKIWSRSGLFMQNGMGLLGNHSTTQSSIII